MALILLRSPLLSSSNWFNWLQQLSPITRHWIELVRMSLLVQMECILSLLTWIWFRLGVWCVLPRVTGVVHSATMSWWEWSKRFLRRSWNRGDVLGCGYWGSMVWLMWIDLLVSITSSSLLYESSFDLMISPFARVYLASSFTVWFHFTTISKMRPIVGFWTPCCWRLSSTTYWFSPLSGILSNPSNSPTTSKQNHRHMRRKMESRLFCTSFSISYNNCLESLSHSQGVLWRSVLSPISAPSSPTDCVQSPICSTPISIYSRPLPTPPSNQQKLCISSLTKLLLSMSVGLWCWTPWMRESS